MNTKQVAEWMREAAVRCEDLRDSLYDRNEISPSPYYAREAEQFRQRAAQVEAMTCDDEAVKEMAEALEGLLYRTEGISLQNKWDAGLMALQKYKASPRFGCIHWEKKP